MEWISRTDAILLGIAAYVAVMALVRLMQRRRDELVADVQRQVEAHRKRPKRPQSDQSRDAA
jgi:hypothetical protein